MHVPVPATKQGRNAIASFAMFVLSLCASTYANAQTAVRFGSVGGLTDAGVYLADEFGYFKQAGLSVAIKRMASAPALVTALATDQLDVAGISITPGLYTAINQGIGLRVVGDKQSFRKGFAATRMVVRAALAKPSRQESVRDLKGKVIAVSAKGSSSFFNIYQILNQAGLKLEDVKIIEMAYPSMIAALSNGAVDAAYVIEPFLSESIRQKIAVEVGEVGSLVEDGKSILSVPLVYSEAFAKKNDIAQSFMTAYVNGVRHYNDAFVKGIDKDRIITILSQKSGVDRGTIRDSFPAGLDPNQFVDEPMLEPYQSFFLSLRMMPAPADLKKLIDSSFARKAVEALGPYK